MPDDPFALLGLPRRFDLSPSLVQAAYLKKSAALHPDRIVDPIAQADAVHQAARVNDARNILANDESRANVLLGLIGGPSKEQDKSLPAGFLLEIMDVRQELEAAVESGNPAERARLAQWADSKREDYKRMIAELLHQALSALAPEVLREARTQLNAWRYIERMIEQLDPDHRPPL